MTRYLVDKSAYEQQRHDERAEATLTAIATEGRLAVCEIIALELLCSTRNASDYEALRTHLDALTWLPVDAAVTRAALDVQRRLAQRGQHRCPIPDLLVAATPLVHDATVLHYDRDFDLIAEVTGQPTAWIIQRGSGHGQT
ncbi:MAG: PIN domain nuclease [Nitriliruptor sp.]